MVDLKCKMCGGTLQITNKRGYATCEYCGSMMTLSNDNNKIVNNEAVELENLLLSVQEAIDEKNWTYVDHGYKLLQEKLPQNIMIEATFFRTVAKIMNDNSTNVYQKQMELCNSLGVIRNYYDVTENKEEVLQRISDFLFKMAFPEGKIIYPRDDSAMRLIEMSQSNLYNNSLTPSAYNLLFYNVMVAFNSKLFILSQTHKDEFIYRLMSKHKQIIMIFNNERKKAMTPAYKIAFVAFLVIAIWGTSACLFLISQGITEDVPFFIAVVLPWLAVIISKSCMENTSDIKKSQTTFKKNSNNVGKTIGNFFKIIWYGWIFVTIVATIIDTANHGITYLIHGIFGITLLGILPGLVVKGIVKLFKKS